MAGALTLLKSAEVINNRPLDQELYKRRLRKRFTLILHMGDAIFSSSAVRMKRKTQRPQSQVRKPGSSTAKPTRRALILSKHRPLTCVSPSERSGLKYTSASVRARSTSVDRSLDERDVSAASAQVLADVMPRRGSDSALAAADVGCMIAVLGRMFVRPGAGTEV